MKPNSADPRQWTRFSPWMIIGSVCILGIILSILAAKHVQQEKQFMERTLLSEAIALMQSIEASGRVGIGRMGWGRIQIQMLMEESAHQPDVLFVALVDKQGRIIAHSRASEVGKTIDYPLPSDVQGTEYRFIDIDNQKVFEAINPYKPSCNLRGRNRRNTEGPPCPLDPSRTDQDLFILVALDPSHFESSIRHSIQQMLALLGVLFLAGAAGFISMMWAQNYRTARRSLQDVQAFTSAVVNQMPIGLLATDLQGRIQRSNEAAQLILNQSIVPNTGIDRFSCFVPILQRLRKEENIIEEEVYYQADERRTVPLHVNSALIRDGRRKIVGFFFLFADMTYLKQLEEQLRRSERLVALGRLAAGVAHEIRNPLSSIKGFAAILGSKAGEDPQARQIAQVMQQEVERLNRVITELLDFARPTELHKQLYSCKEIVRNTLRLVEQDAHHQNVRVEWEVVPDDLQAEVDPDRFAQILLNLYLNALQSMEREGTLKVEVRKETDRVVWKVTDSGKGISSQDLPHIFDPYFTTKPHGVGLGLANVCKLVEAHGGNIEVTSVPGRGTSFVLHLPLNGLKHSPPFPPVSFEQENDPKERRM